MHRLYKLLSTPFCILAVLLFAVGCSPETKPEESMSAEELAIQKEIQLEEKRQSSLEALKEIEDSRPRTLQLVPSNYTAHEFGPCPEILAQLSLNVPEGMDLETLLVEGTDEVWRDLDIKSALCYEFELTDNANHLFASADIDDLKLMASRDTDTLLLAGEAIFTAKIIDEASIRPDTVCDLNVIVELRVNSENKISGTVSQSVDNVQGEHEQLCDAFISSFVVS